MTIVAGYSATRRNQAPIELAVKLAATTGEPISVVAVVERRSPPHSDPVEDEYLDYVTVQAERALHSAVEDLPSGGVTVDVRVGPSIAKTLAAYAREVDAGVVTVGASSSSLLGRIALGGVTNRVVHGGSTPVVIAPRGYLAGRGPFRRITVSYGGRADVHRLIPGAAELAARWGVPLRIVSFAVRDVAAVGISAPPAAESLVVDKWWQQTQDGIRRQLEEVRGQMSGADLQVEMGSGEDWRSAVESVGWDGDDLLVLGSGAAAPSQQIFLGTAAARILRAAPVPVMILPNVVDQ
ncbi:MAG: universal stress protein [Gordonia sp. (in: high G+C Gram-positive bacteria)]|uniref:universal stress protein n=1 Tax=Gordonia sp. (in: high G+C Gram-positive bacteria) TaxID=84139 RepID=UPI0039E729D2